MHGRWCCTCPCLRQWKGGGWGRRNEEERGEGMGRAPQKGNTNQCTQTSKHRHAKKSKSYTPFAHPLLRQNNMVRERENLGELGQGFSTNSKFAPPSNIRRFDYPTPVSNFSWLGWAGEQRVNMSTWTRRALSFPQQDNSYWCEIHVALVFARVRIQEKFPRG